LRGLKIKRIREELGGTRIERNKNREESLKETKTKEN